MAAHTSHGAVVLDVPNIRPAPSELNATFPEPIPWKTGWVGIVASIDRDTSWVLPAPTVAAQNTLTPDQIGKSACTGDRLPTRRTDYIAPDDMKLDPAKSYLATIETVKGTIRAELYPKLAPEHVNSFVFLACQGFFDGLTFHRYEPGFVIQGGDPKGNGSGGPGYTLPAEFNATKHTLGILSMARTSDPNSAGSQFFIMLGDAPHLDNQYSVFGKVVEGITLALQIRANDKVIKVNITVR